MANPPDEIAAHLGRYPKRGHDQQRVATLRWSIRLSCWGMSFHLQRRLDARGHCWTKSTKWAEPERQPTATHPPSWRWEKRTAAEG